MPSLNILMVPLGTDGDVYPYIGLGVALAERGHRITLIANEHFAPLAHRHDFAFVAAGSSQEYAEALDNRHMLTHPVRGALPLRRLFCRAIPRQYRAIAACAEPGRTIILASGFASGARIAHEKLGVPMAILALQPMLLPVVAKLPHVPNWFPDLGKRFGWWVAALVGELIMGRDARALRAEIGLPPMYRVSSDWWLGPDLAIGLFPDWYAGPQPPWTIETKFTGFVTYDGVPDSADDDSGGIEDFLREGEPPIVFTPGTGIRHGGSFFRAAIDACALLQRRGLLITPCAKQMPASLPDDVLHVRYAPFGKLLPRAAAIVHHGGIGTTARAMAAGIPQLVVPRIFDQADNAKRLHRLGVGDIIPPRAFRGPILAGRLDRLLASSPTRDACRRVSEKCRDEDALQKTCDLVERLVPV
jgi:UDP:flavonoid glycosyltransferase YjiC (YdhE family)